MITDQPDPNWEQSSYVSSWGVPPPPTTNLLLSISLAPPKKSTSREEEKKQKRNHTIHFLSIPPLFTSPPSPPSPSQQTNVTTQQQCPPPTKTAPATERWRRSRPRLPVAASRPGPPSTPSRNKTTRVLDLKTTYVLRMKRQDDKIARLERDVASLLLQQASSSSAAPVAGTGGGGDWEVITK